MNMMYYLADYILTTWTYLEHETNAFCHAYDLEYDEMCSLHGDLRDIIEKVFEEKEFKRIMRLIKKDKEE